MQKIRYLVFDVESVADGELVARLQFPGKKLSPSRAIRKYRDELLEARGSDFIPYTFQLPVAIAIAKVASDFRLLDLVVLDAPAFRPPVITDAFWRGWEHYGRPVLVSFNGRTFDLPLLELAAYRYGLSLPDWFAVAARTYDQPRNRYNLDAHIDLQELLTNFGATRFTGGLNLAANLLGKPGKMEVQGNMVQDLYDDGQIQRINDYCQCDTLDTYFAFLRTRVLIGELTIEKEQKIVADAKSWIESKADTNRAFTEYLEKWSDWHDPAAL